MGGADGGWRDWWVAAVVAVSVVGEAAVVGVSVGAGDGVLGCADGGGWEGGPVSWWFSEGVVAIGRRCCFRWCS